MSTTDASSPRELEPGLSVRAPKTAELVAMRLRSKIVHGELVAGDVLPTEAQLMEQFGVSRPTLREAIRILEAESLISSRRGTRGGAQVTGPDIGVAARYVGLILQLQGTTLADVYEARMISEPACAGLLAERHSERDLRDLRACIEQLHRLGERDLESAAALSEWSALSSRFHRLITERAGNRTLAVQAGVVRDIIDTHHAHAFTKGARTDRPAENFHRNLRSLEKLVGLIAAGDREGAQSHWTEHMRAAGKGLFRDGSGQTTIVDLFA
ncbi:MULTISPECIES: FadR/GntR family transcriptional regulator [Nocardia]|jgi:DNA-binding FadR family transcriptional regulator|uniref:FadR family transcriptional regulator n=2 Tax=Nocardia TaxID=1817 RepID=A0A2T2ZBY9_9NOCA|nr:MULTISPECIES: GntR family transcriptional regulator [Nocardia]MDN2496781.1 FadR family transcriptional regulator [Nocardia nova]PSR65269.1 FadR family transcriptional regulator [Nocardia nova]